MTVLMINDEAIFAAAGKEGRLPQIRNIQKIELTGYGEAKERWKTGIEKLQAQMDLAQVRLVLPAAKSSARVQQLPWVKQKELQKIARREFQEVFKSEILDYALIRSDRETGNMLVGASAEESVLKQLLEICGELNIQVKAVTVPMEGLLRVLPRLDGYRERTAIYLFFEEGAVTSVLSENGVYKYSSRSRLFSEPGTIDFGTEIVRNISGILQFQAASKSESAITEVYYAGCPEDDFDVSREGIANLNLQAFRMQNPQGVTLPEGTDSSYYLPLIGAMLANQHKMRDINLLESLQQSHQEEKKDTALWKHFILPAAAFLVSAAVFGGIFLANGRLNADLGEIRAWLADEQNQKAYQESLLLEERREVLQSCLRELQTTDRNRASYPKLEQQVFEAIAGAGGEGIFSTISGYSADTGKMTFEATSTQAIDIPSYIERLDKTGLFHSVEYTGYIFEDEAYTLSLLCTLKGNEEGSEA